MIGRLRGILLEKSPPHLLLDVSGVAYELDAPMFTFYRLPEIGQEAILHTHLVVREDAQLLYGFSEERERALFRSLIKVSAVGPKLALAILSGIEPDQFVHCVISGDTNSLVRIPGIGKKTAERLAIEMRDKLNDWQYNGSETVAATSTIGKPADTITQEAISALLSLGYKPFEARRAITEIANDYQNSEDLIRHALRSMMKGVS